MCLERGSSSAMKESSDSSYESLNTPESSHIPHSLHELHLPQQSWIGRLHFLCRNLTLKRAVKRPKRPAGLQHAHFIATPEGAAPEGAFFLETYTHHRNERTQKSQVDVPWGSTKTFLHSRVSPH